MRRPLLWGVLALVLLAGFYVAWPAWTAYRVRTAIETGDVALLESKIDFASVKANLRPVIVAEIERGMEKARREGGPLASIIVGQIKGDLAGRIVDGVLNTVATPQNVIRIVREGADFRRAFEEAAREQAGGGSVRLPGLGGLGRSRAAPVGKPADAPQGERAPPRRPGLANIKQLAALGPLAFRIGYARDAAQAEPDITAELRFTGFDWKVVSLTPRLPAG